MNLNRPIWPSTYVESPAIPKRARRRLVEFGGRNLYGDPNYQIVWAMDAEIFENGNPHARKYPNPRDVNLGYACFWVERYTTAEFWDEKIWNELRYGDCELGTGKKIDLLGSFPRRGRYVGVGPLIKDNEYGEPWEALPLTTKVLDELIRNLDPGASTSKVLGRLAIGNAVRKANSAALCQKELGKVRDYFRTNAEKINAQHTRDYAHPAFKPSSDHAAMGTQITGAPASVRQFFGLQHKMATAMQAPTS